MLWEYFFHLSIFDDLRIGFIVLNSNQQLFLLGGIAIATGIITYSWKVMDTVGSNILELSSEAALVIVLAESLVLFIFSSSGLSQFFVNLGFPPIPLVPVSSSQVIVGCILGIGLYKGARNINFKVLGEIGLAWIISPIASGLLTFLLLFFMKNIFNIEVGGLSTSSTAVSQGSGALAGSGPGISAIVRYILLGILIFGTAGISYYLLLDRKKKSGLRKSEEHFWLNLK